LPQIADLTVISGDASHAIIEMADDPLVHAALLKTLIGQDFKVASFAPDRFGLQDAYLTHVKNGTAQKVTASGSVGVSVQ
jgi:hypothetical protein